MQTGRRNIHQCNCVICIVCNECGRANRGDGRTAERMIDINRVYPGVKIGNGVVTEQRPKYKCIVAGRYGQSYDRSKNEQAKKRRSLSSFS